MRIHLVILLVCVIAASVVKGSPSYQVTLGSRFTITAEDAGVNSFSKRTRALVYHGRRSIAISAKTSEDLSELNCEWKKAIPPGVYELVVETDGADGETTTISVTNYFAVVAPRIYQVSSSTATSGDEITVKGRFFGDRCSVFMGSDAGDMRKCRSRSEMDADTGASSATVVVPRGVESLDDTLIQVVNAVGTDLETIDSDLTDDTGIAYVVSVGDIHETSRYVDKLKNFISTFKTVHAGKTVAVNAGDILSAYPRKSYDPEWARDLYTSDPAAHGVEIFTMLEGVPFDAVAIGNHDPCLGLDKLVEFYGEFELTAGGSNLSRYVNGECVPWYLAADSANVERRVSVHLKGLDVGIVVSCSTFPHYWTYEDLNDYRFNTAIDERVVSDIRLSSLLNDVVVLVTHQNDLSSIIPVYGNDPQPSGEYKANSDIYALKDLERLALIVGGHEHKNFFRRASYSGDNEKYALYIDKVYNPDSKLVLVKSSKFFGEYVGVCRIAWDIATFDLDTVNLVEGLRDDDGNYKGCESEYLFDTDDDGYIQELDESPWNPDTTSHWWKMDDWPIAD